MSVHNLNFCARKELFLSCHIILTKKVKKVVQINGMPTYFKNQNFTSLFRWKSASPDGLNR
jgi:hypothetical protein